MIESTNPHMRQSEAKRIAEHLLGRQVKLKHVGYSCCIFPQTEESVKSFRAGSLIHGVLQFEKRTVYYGPDWGHAVFELEKHVAIDQAARAHEGKQVKCPKCDEGENLSISEDEKTFRCDSCQHTWDVPIGVRIEGIDEAIPMDREGKIDGQLVVPPGFERVEHSTEPDTDVLQPIREQQAANQPQQEGNTMAEAQQPQQGNTPPKPRVQGDAPTAAHKQETAADQAQKATGHVGGTGAGAGSPAAGTNITVQASVTPGGQSNSEQVDEQNKKDQAEGTRSADGTSFPQGQAEKDDPNRSFPPTQNQPGV